MKAVYLSEYNDHEKDYQRILYALYQICDGDAAILALAEGLADSAIARESARQDILKNGYSDNDIYQEGLRLDQPI